MSVVPESAPVGRGPFPSGTVSFVFTDIEGSTQHWDRDRAAMQEAVARHDARMRAAIAAHDGYVFKTVGEAFCATFWRPEDAVAAMLAAQRALTAEDFTAVGGLRMRAAVHIGTADERDGDYFGPVVNRVARLLSIGHGGQVLVSGVTAALVITLLPAGASLRDLGRHRLKDLSAPEHVFELAAPDLPADHPPLRSLDAHPNNLPAALTTFIGREREIAEVTALLRDQRLVTLVGAGGIGKTRLTLQVAANVLDGSGDGVWLMEFAPLASGEYLPAAIARELNITLTAAGDPVDKLVAALAAKHALLVFDNCEHIIDDVARVAAALLRGCAKITILASSRQALGIAGEQTYRLPSLAVPQPRDEQPLTANEAAQSAAVALFVERARAADQRFALTDVNASIIAEICRRLDGIALAIELAAARVKLLSPRQLQNRLDERFRVLTGGRRDALPRQQTLRALIDWSYDLLDGRERALFRWLGVFVNGFTLEAAIAVAGGDDLDEFDVIDLLTSLTDKSLLLAEPTGDALRYRMLESTRAYALERLHADGEREPSARRHAAFFAEFAGDGMTLQADIAARLAAIDAELDNLREALTWALADRHDVHLGAGIAFALGRFWSTRLPREGHHWLALAQAALADRSDLVLAARVASAIAAMLPHGSFERFEASRQALEAACLTDDSRSLTKAFAAYGEQVQPAGRLDEANAAFEEALERARAIGSDWDAARALAGLGSIAVDRGEITAAREFGDRAIQLFEKLGASDGIAYVSILLGEAEFVAGDAERAIELTRRGRAAHGDLGNNRSSACAANLLAGFALTVDKRDDARAYARDALHLLRTDRHPLFLTVAIEQLAHLATLGGDPRRGALLQGYAESVFTTLAHARSHAAEHCYERHRRLLAQALEADELARLSAAGAMLSEGRALEEALAV